MPGNEKLRRRHHIVPRFHLKRFADERGMLMRVVLPGEKRHLISVNDATVEKDFYLVEEEDGRQHDEVEKLLGMVEDPAATAISQLLDGSMWPIPPDAREAIAIWAAFQYLRSPTRRQIGNELADSITKMQIGMGGKAQIRVRLRERDGREPTHAEVDEAWTEYSDFDSYWVEPHQNDHIKSMLDTLPMAFSMFYDRGWALFRFERRALITSDNPVVLIPADDHPSFLGVGLRNAGGIYVPLDRRVGLLMIDKGMPDGNVPGTTAYANDFNFRVAGNAQKAVFHHPDDDPFANVPVPKPRDRITNADEQLHKFFPPEALLPADDEPAT
jgi:hypothetical protein